MAFFNAALQDRLYSGVTKTIASERPTISPRSASWCGRTRQTWGVQRRLSARRVSVVESWKNVLGERADRDNPPVYASAARIGDLTGVHRSEDRGTIAGRGTRLRGTAVPRRGSRRTASLARRLPGFGDVRVGSACFPGCPRHERDLPHVGREEITLT